MKPFVLPLSDQQTDLATVGGKGASLANLLRAGLPVPDGYHITTHAYQAFITANDLQIPILKALSGIEPNHPATFEEASQAVGRLFVNAKIPEDVEKAVVQAYTALPGVDPAVAVRSSATAEDLPEASFAGQQDSFLNISGVPQVLEAVRKCWASLWTGRAIAYRQRQGIPPDSISLAVVVQLLIPAEAAGIMFTANPINGKRREMVINAAWGLGEAIVAGSVTPDRIILDKHSRRIEGRATAEKQVMTVRSAFGTELHPVPAALQKQPVLSDDQAVELARLGVRIEDLYRLPMDIEWALCNGKFAILQARPITALAEEPLDWTPPDPKGIFMRTSIVDLMPDPLSPLFTTLGVPALIAQMYPLGKRLTRRHPVLPDPYFTTINNYAYMNAHFSGRAWIWVLFGLIPAYPRLLRTLIPLWRDELLPQYQKTVAALQDKKFENMTAKELWQETQTIMDAIAYYSCALLFATMGASAGSEGLLTKIYEKMIQKEGDPPATVLLMGWDNIPIRSEKSLFDLAAFCHERPSLAEYISNSDAEQAARQFQAGDTPAGVSKEDWSAWQEQFNRHLDRFGHIIFQLDFAEDLPRDHLAPMIKAMQMYLRGEGINPYQRQKASEQKRLQTAENALARLKGMRRWAFRKSLNWAQSLSEVREDALADIGLGYPAIRRMLFILGDRLVKAGILQDVQDIFWLEKHDIDQVIVALEQDSIPENKFSLVKQRKDFAQKARREIPPPMLPPSKKYLGINTSVWLAESDSSQTGGALKGVPSSPGRVTARARILHGPEDFNRMQPGEVLVAGTTTPAWTPLFAMASAVVTDIGGPLSHGSIVAREYGIPAVMGTGVATRRIRDEQMITVDGGAGLVILLEENGNS